MHTKKKIQKKMYFNDVDVMNTIMEPNVNNYLYNSEEQEELCTICDKKYGNKMYKNKAVCNRCLDFIRNM